MFEILLVGAASTDPAVVESFPSEVRTVTARTGSEASRRLGSGGIDCAVCDAGLSDEDISAVVEAADGVEPSVPVITHGPESSAAGGAVASVGRADELVDRAVATARRYAALADPTGRDGVETTFRLEERILEEAPVGVTISDPSVRDNPVVYVNEAFERITGYDRHEVIGRNCRFLQGPDSDPEAIAAMSRAVDDGRPVSVELLNYRKNGEPFWNNVDISPVHEDGELAYLVGFQTDITERKEAELRAERRATELEAERRSLERLLARVNGLVGTVTAAAVGAASRSELESRVCDRVVETTDYSAAWIGRLELTDDRVVATAQTACGGVDGIEIPAAADDPVARAIDTGEVATAEGADPGASIHRGLGSHRSRTVAIPLSYNDRCYGVLTIYADRPASFDRNERAVLSGIGRVVATAINALENQRLLLTDEYLEIGLSSTDEGLFFVPLSSQLDCTLTYRGSTHEDDDRLQSLFVVEGADPDRIVEAASGIEGIERASLITHRDDGCLFGFETTDDSIARTVVGHNGSVESITASSGRARVEIAIPQSAHPRMIVGRLVERYPDTNVLFQRRRERTTQTGPAFSERLEAELTGKQLTALRRAFHYGYYEWPRPVEGEDVAESMGITRSTFHQHLRVAERKLVAGFLDEPN